MSRIALELQPGIVSDETTFATPGFWVDGNNVRFANGRPETIGGWAKFNATIPTGTCRSLHGWYDNLSRENIAIGTNSALQVIRTGAIYDITPTGLVEGSVDALPNGGSWGFGGWGSGGWGGGPLTEDFPRTWSFGNYGETLIANPRNRGIYQWENDTATVAAQVTNSPENVICILVTPERQIVAFGCNEEVSGLFNPRCIRGCDLENITDWTTSSNDNVFEHILEGGGGVIIGARQFGPYVLVWTESSLHVGEFVGLPNQTYRFDLVSGNCGLANAQSAVVYDQTAYWMTPDFQFYSYQFGGVPTPLPCPIINDFRDNIDTVQLSKTVGVPVTRFSEVWWFYPDTRDGDENSRYIAFDRQQGIWFRGQMARSAAVDRPATYPIFGAPASYLYSHEYGDDADGSELTWHVTSSGQYFDDAYRHFHVRGMWPDFEDQTGAVTMTLFTQRFPKSSLVAKGPYTIGTATEKVDFLTQGRIISVKFEASLAGTFARLGKPTFDVRPGGRF